MTFKNAAKHAQWLSEIVLFYYKDHGLTQEQAYELSKQLKLLAIQITHADSLHDLKFVYAVITMFNNKVSVFKHSKREYSIHYNIRDHILNKLNSCIATGNNFKVREELMKLMAGQGLPVFRTPEIVNAVFSILIKIEQSAMPLSSDQVKKTMEEIDHLVDPSSNRYGKLLNWQNPPDPFWHYGIGLSDAHIFDPGQGLCPFERSEANFVLGIDHIAFSPNQTIKRLKACSQCFRRLGIYSIRLELRASWSIDCYRPAKMLSKQSYFGGCAT